MILEDIITGQLHANIQQILFAQSLPTRHPSVFHEVLFTVRLTSILHGMDRAVIRGEAFMIFDSLYGFRLLE